MYKVVRYFITVFIFTLVSCDPAYRIRRDSQQQLSYAVSFDCMISAIKTVPNAKISSNRIAYPKRVCKQGHTSRQTLYSIDKESIVLTACYDGDTLKTFSHDKGGWVGGQKSEKASATLAKMRAVENAIETHCNVKGLSTEIQNNCTRIECND